MPFFELRTYPMKPNKLADFVKFMDEDIIPYQVSLGMVVVGAFSDEENDQYVWIRRFESESEREKLYEAVYQSDHWRNVLSPQVGEHIDREGIVVKTNHTVRPFDHTLNTLR